MIKQSSEHNYNAAKETLDWKQMMSVTFGTVVNILCGKKETAIKNKISDLIFFQVLVPTPLFRQLPKISLLQVFNNFHFL